MQLFDAINFSFGQWGNAMQRRHRNIPTEIVRTIVAVVETGSFTKAGEKLSLSQPAISSQIKKMEVFAGGSIFERSATGVRLTSRGQLALSYARRMLDANDQILSLGGGTGDANAIRIGLSTIFAEQL